MHPLLVRRLTYPYFQWRMGRRVEERVAELERSQWEAPDRLRQVQWAKLRKLLVHAAARVPYYRTLFRDLDLRIEEMQAPEDLARIPLLTKHAVRDRGAQLVAEGAVRLSRRRTSGSTGIPLQTFIDAPCWEWWLAAERRSRRWWGVEVGDRDALLTTSRSGGRGRLKRYHLLNEGVFTALDLSDQAMGELYRRLVRFRPTFLRGFPTMLAQFAQFILGRYGSAEGLRLKAAFTTAEVLYPDQRSVIAAAFQCPVVNEYGSSENWLVAAECPHGRMHVMAENVYVEARPVGANGRGPSEIILTDLNNYGMPFIRYAIGDLGAPLGEHCPCGRGLPLLDLKGGRTADLAVTPEGRYLDESVFCRIFEEIGPGRVRQFRIIQEALGRFTVLVAADRDGGLTEIVGADFRRILGPGVLVDVRIVPEIPRESSGKLRRFVSRLQHPLVRHREGATV